MRPLAFTAALLAPLAALAGEPLPAWHDGAAKSAIIEFVEAAGPSFTQFAPRQKAARFSLDQVMEKLPSTTGGN